MEARPCEEKVRNVSVGLCIANMTLEIRKICHESSKPSYIIYENADMNLQISPYTLSCTLLYF